MQETPVTYYMVNCQLLNLEVQKKLNVVKLPTSLALQ